MDDDTVKLILKGDLEGLCIFSNALDGDEKIAIDHGWVLPGREGDDVGVVVMPKESFVHGAQVAIATKNNVDGSRTEGLLADGFHQPVGQLIFCR